MQYQSLCYLLSDFDWMDQRGQLNRKLRFGDCHLLAQFARSNVITAPFYKASCLSLVSNAILCWNTIKINGIVENLRQQGEEIDNEALSRISLLPHKHILPHRSYFIDEF